MTQKKFQEILSYIRRETGLISNNKLYDYLETIDKVELNQLIHAVSVEFDVSATDFGRKLLGFLTIRAKPWASIADIQYSNKLKK